MPDQFSVVNVFPFTRQSVYSDSDMLGTFSLALAGSHVQADATCQSTANY